MAKQKAATTDGLRLAVSFGNVNIGDETANISLKIQRTAMSLAAADRNLCGKRLSGTIIARCNGATGDQDSLPGMEGEDSTLDGVFDVNSFSVSRKKFGTSLTFALASISVETLSKFAKREGQFIVNSIEDIPEKEKAAKVSRDDEDD